MFPFGLDSYSGLPHSWILLDTKSKLQEKSYFLITELSVSLISFKSRLLNSYLSCVINKLIFKKRLFNLIIFRYLISYH